LATAPKENACALVRTGTRLS